MMAVEPGSLSSLGDKPPTQHNRRAIWVFWVVLGIVLVADYGERLREKTA